MSNSSDNVQKDVPFFEDGKERTVSDGSYERAMKAQEEARKNIPGGTGV